MVAIRWVLRWRDSHWCLSMALSSLLVFSSWLARGEWTRCMMMLFWLLVNWVLIIHWLQEVLREFTSEVLVSFLLSSNSFGCWSVMFCLLLRRNHWECATHAIILHMSEGLIILRWGKLISIWLQTDCLRLLKTRIALSLSLPWIIMSSLFRSIVLTFWKIVTLASICIASFWCMGCRVCWLRVFGAWERLSKLLFIVSRAKVHLLHVQMIILVGLMEFNSRGVGWRWEAGFCFVMKIREGHLIWNSAFFFIASWLPTWKLVRWIALDYFILFLVLVVKDLIWFLKMIPCLDLFCFLDFFLSGFLLVFKWSSPRFIFFLEWKLES